MTAQKIVTTNNPIKMLVLGLQHLIAMFGATVLVPYLTGLDPAVALIAAGGGTLIFQLCTNGKVPVFIGSSFAFIGVIITVKEMHGGDLGYAQGGIIAVGLLYVIFSFFIKKIGVHNVKKVLPNHVVGPIIVIIGFSLLPVALDMARKDPLEKFQHLQILFAIITLGTT
ncbi:uracil permease, partial [bacterium]|nr:uracil permease [bacterium]